MTFRFPIKIDPTVLRQDGPVSIAMGVVNALLRNEKSWQEEELAEMLRKFAKDAYELQRYPAAEREGPKASADRLFECIAASCIHSYAEVASENDPKSLSSRIRLSAIWSKISGAVLPAGHSIDIDALHLARTANTSRRYKLTFPTITEGEECGDLFDVWVTLLQESAGFFPDSDNVALAPWSQIRIGSEEIKSLSNIVQGKVQTTLGFPAQQLYLIEIAARWSPKNRQLERCDISGESLTLAVLLAAWAAHNRCELFEMVITGMVLEDNHGSVVINRVDGILEKLNAFVGSEYGFKWFLCPDSNYQEILLKSEKRTHALPKNIAGLTESAFVDLVLTDGLDRYRRAIAGIKEDQFQLPQVADADAAGATPSYPPGALEGFMKEDIDQFASESSEWIPKLTSSLEPCDLESSKQPGSPKDEERNGRYRVLPIPFNEPSDEIARWFVSEWKSEVQKSKESIAIIPVEVSTSGANDPIKRFCESVISGVKNLQLSTEQLINPDVIRNLAADGTSRPIGFVFYGPRSLNVDYDAEKKMLEQIRNTLLIGSPRTAFIFIASDLHHANFIESILSVTS